MNSSDELDRLRALHAFGSHPSWSWTARSLIDRDDATTDEIITWLAGQPSAVVGTRLTDGNTTRPLYPTKKPDPRIRLFRTLDVSETSDPEQLALDPKRLELALEDPDASDIDGLWLRGGKGWKSLMKMLPTMTARSIRLLRATKAPHPEELAAVLSSPRFASLERLSLGGDSKATKGEVVAAIANAPCARTLRQLVIWGADKFGAADFTKLGQADFPVLESFMIHEGSWIPRTTVRTGLFHAGWMSQLRSLSIDHLTSSELDLLAKNVPFEKLVAFQTTVRGGKHAESAGMFRPVMERLAACQSLAFLTQGNDRLDKGLAASLLRSGCVPQLEELRADVAQDAAAVLAEAGGSPAACDERAKARRAAAGFWWRWH